MIVRRRRRCRTDKANSVEKKQKSQQTIQLQPATHRAIAVRQIVNIEKEWKDWCTGGNFVFGLYNCFWVIGGNSGFLQFEL